MALLNNQRVFTPPQKMDLATLKLLQALSVRRVRADACSFGAVLGKTKMASALLTWMKDERTVFLQECVELEIYVYMYVLYNYIIY